MIKKICIGIIAYIIPITTIQAKDKNDIIEEILAKAEMAFDEADHAKKIEVVSQKIDFEYILVNPRDRSRKIRPTHYSDFSPNSSTGYYVNAISLAIAHADLARTQKFLDVIDNINSENLWIWGYNQKYTLAHVALHPTAYYCQNEDYDERFAILQTLASKNMDWTIVPTGHVNNYAAINAGWQGGKMRKTHVRTLISLALLCGADPIVRNENHTFSESLLKVKDLENPDSKVFKLIYEYGKKFEQGFDHMHPDTKAAFDRGRSKDEFA